MRAYLLPLLLEEKQVKEKGFSVSHGETGCGYMTWPDQFPNASVHYLFPWGVVNGRRPKCLSTRCVM